MSHARHMTMLVGGDTTCIAQEPPEEIVARIESALRDGVGWFRVTAHPEGEPFWMNAAQLVYVGRERRER